MKGKGRPSEYSEGREEGKQGAEREENNNRCKLTKGESKEW